MGETAPVEETATFARAEGGNEAFSAGGHLQQPRCLAVGRRPERAVARKHRGPPHLGVGGQDPRFHKVMGDARGGRLPGRLHPPRDCQVQTIPPPRGELSSERSAKSRVGKAPLFTPVRYKSGFFGSRQP